MVASIGSSGMLCSSAFRDYGQERQPRKGRGMFLAMMVTRTRLPEYTFPSPLGLESSPPLPASCLKNVEVEFCALTSLISPNDACLLFLEFESDLERPH